MLKNLAPEFSKEVSGMVDKLLKNNNNCGTLFGDIAKKMNIGNNNVNDFKQKTYVDGISPRK